MPRRTGLFLLPKFSIFVPVQNELGSDASYDELLPDYRQNMQTGETGSVYAFQFDVKKDGVYSVTAKTKKRRQ